jgi:hypothetical protein
MRGTIELNPSALPRLSVPPQVNFVPDAAASRAALAALNPSESAVVEAAPHVVMQVPVDLEVLEYRDDSYRIRYSASSEALLRIAVPYAPRWGATVDHRPVKVLPTDYAFCGVILPAGRHELLLEFRPLSFRLGASVSLAGAIVLVLSLMLRLASRSSTAVR